LVVAFVECNIELKNHRNGGRTSCCKSLETLDF
jgi:hypothetical protein